MTGDGYRPDSLPKVLSEDEQEALLDQFSSRNRYWTPARNWTMCVTMLDAGLRVGELTALKVEHLDRQGRRIIIRDGKGAKDRIVPMTDRLYRALEDWLDRRTELDGVDDGCELVFPSQKGSTIDSRNVTRFVKREAKDAGIAEASRVSSHTLRHSFASDLYRKTGNLRIVQEALGHSSIQTTQIYTHIVNGELEDAVQGFRTEAENEAETDDDQNEDDRESVIAAATW